MSDELATFWHDTWSAWRSGAISPISPDAAKMAAVEFKDFVTLISNPKNPFIGDKYLMLTRFFGEHPPRPHEFLVGASHKAGLMILTSQRLWMSDRQTGEYVALDLADVAEYRIRPHWTSFIVTVRFKDGTERTYTKLASAPSAQGAALALRLCESTPAGIVPPEPAPSSGKEEAGAALLEIFARHVSDVRPRVVGAAWWDTLASKADTAVNEALRYVPGLFLGGLLGGPLMGPHRDYHRAGLVAVTEGELFVVDLAETDTTHLTVERLCDLKGTPRVQRALLRDLEAQYDARAGVLALGGDLSVKLTFPASISDDNYSKGAVVARMIRDAVESAAAPGEEWECDVCGAALGADEMVCPACGTRFES
jgi:hypothetical protein